MKTTTDLRKYARGKDCQVRLIGICSYDPEQTVLAHLNGAGMARKHPDLMGAWCCSACHRVYDAYEGTQYQTQQQVQMSFYEGMHRTQIKLIEEGVVTW